MEEAAVPVPHWNSEAEQGGGVDAKQLSVDTQNSLSPIDPWQGSPPNWPNTSTVRERL